MELNNENIDLLDRFFRNELAPGEAARLQSLMKDTDFAEEANTYLETFDVVAAAGRMDLHAQLKSIHQELENSEGYDSYKPSIKGSGLGGGLYFTIVAVITAVIGYFYFTGETGTESIQNIIPKDEKLDTVYHYNVIRDTFYAAKGDTVRKTRHRTNSDTVFIRSQVPASIHKEEIVNDTSSVNKEIIIKDTSVKKRPKENSAQENIMEIFRTNK